MSMQFEGPFLIVNFPNSEASIKNQISNIRPREVSGFYTSDDVAKKTEIVEFLAISSTSFYVDFSKTKSYISEVKRYIMPFRKFFRKELVDFHDESSLFEINKGYQTLKVYLGGENDRYLKFDTEDEVSRKFKNILLPCVSDLVMEKRSSGVYAFPRMRSDFLSVFNVPDLYIRKSFFEQGEYTTDQLITELVSYYNAFSSDVVFGIHLFGIRFCTVIENSSISSKQLIERLHIDKLYATELDKGVRIGLYLQEGSTMLQSRVSQIIHN